MCIVVSIIKFNRISITSFPRHPNDVPGFTPRTGHSDSCVRAYVALFQLTTCKLFQLTTCKPPTQNPQKRPNLVFVPKSCAMFWNLWKNTFPIFILWDMVDFELKILSKLTKNLAKHFMSQKMRNVLKRIKNRFSDF